MSTPIVLKYPYDPTGVADTNLVTGEIHTVPRSKNRAFATNHGPFYTKNLVLRGPDGTVLTAHTDYLALQLYPEASQATGQEVCAIIQIINDQIAGDISVDYHVVGGEYSISAQALKDLIDQLEIDNRPVAWADVIGKPSQFPPSPHMHDAADLYGMQHVVIALEDLRSAILQGDVASHDLIYQALENLRVYSVAAIKDLSDVVQTHVRDANNPHVTTKAQVGLGSVDNFPTASVDEATAGTAQDRFMTPYLVAQAISKQAGDLINKHIADKNNPHGVTKAQVGLGNVDNYASAGQSDAEAGVAGNMFMTPLRVMQAINKNALVPLNAHINNTNNPHNVTKAQVGLASVDNARQVQLGGGTNMGTNKIYMGWDGGQILIQVDGSSMGRVHTTNQPDPSIANHVNNRNNPHGVTTAQIGAVPTSRLINGHRLDGDFNLGANELGAYTADQVNNLLAGYVQDVRWTGETQIVNSQFAPYSSGRRTTVPDGGVLSNIADVVTKQVWLEDVDAVWWRYLQKKINGNWYNVGT